KLLRQADWYFRGTNRARASLLRGKSRTAPLAEALDDGVLAGRSVRLADVAEESRVYGDRDSDAGPRNWSEHGAIFSRQWRAVESVALPAPGAVADGVFEDASVPGKLDQLSQFSGLAEEQQQFFGIGGLSQQRFQFDGTGRSGTAAGLHDFGGFFSRARRERGEGAHVSTRGGSAGGGAGGAHQRGPVEEKILPRDIYTPIGQWNDPTFRDRRISMGTNAVGRLKAGVSERQAQSDMDAIAQSLAAAYPESNHESGINLVGLKKDLVGDIEPFLLVLLGAVAFVLLIACANVANLLLARSTARRREFAVRAAMGAGPGRVIRQLLTESVLLALGGGAMGLLIAWWGTKFVLSALPQALPRAREIGIDGRVLFFTLGISLLAGIVFGLAPALSGWRTDLQETLKEGGRGGSGA